MLRHSLLSVAACITCAVPSVAAALDVTTQHVYRDIPPGRSEAVAVAVLLNKGIVKPAERFFTTRRVNRAEFLSMAMTWYFMAHDNPFSGYDYYRNGRVVDGRCFPDARVEDWYGPAVCEAFDAGFVGGYPDGLFHPERPVQYDEALKMLTAIFGYKIPALAEREWGERYYRAAATKGVDLPVRMQLDRVLNRGMASRLLAAFIAEKEGALEVLRRAEAGQLPTETSSASSASSQSSSPGAVSSSSSSSSSFSSSAASVASSSLFALPLQNHFLLTGRASPAIASVEIPADASTVYVSQISVKLAAEASALKRLELTTDDGTVLATLERRTTTDQLDYRRTYEAAIPDNLQVPLAPGRAHTLFVRAVVRDRNDAGFSENLVQVRSVLVTARTADFRTLSIPATGPFPSQQTSFGRVRAVACNQPLPAPRTMTKSYNILRCAFETEGDNAALFSPITFTLRLGTENVSSINGWVVRTISGTQVGTCSFNPAEQTIGCTITDRAAASVPFGSSLTIDLFADVNPTAAIPTFSFTTDGTGTPEQGAFLSWTDGSGTFHWVEPTSLGPTLR